MRESCLILILFITFCGINSLPEQGKWIVHISEKQETNLFYFTKTMFNDSSVYVQIHCPKNEKDYTIDYKWVLRYSPCADEFTATAEDGALQYLNHPEKEMFRGQYEWAEFKQDHSSSRQTCSLNQINFETSDAKVVRKKFFRKPLAVTNSTTKPTKKLTTHKVNKRAAVAPTLPTTANTTTNANVTESTGKLTLPPGKDSKSENLTPLTSTWRDGAYLFVLEISFEAPDKSKKNKVSYDLTVQMKGSYGYLSALEWPFLIFYGVMCLVYLVYAIVWTILSACHWRDILRVQFWIGAVILLGMLEKAMFYAEYQSINSTGLSVRGAVIFAEFVSCIKRTLARLLVMVVSIGYGIVKPRLGPALVKVVVIGIAYFVFALIEGCIRVLRPRFDMPRTILMVQVPLALTDAIILWWTFTYLVQTIQQMRLRRNIVKFNLYKHFSNILILVVGVSVVFMGWSVFYHKWFQCKKHWREIWVDDAFWHILFSVILLVIIWLWRPSKNNQRYAYSPVLDADDDADEDVLMDNLTTGELKKKTTHSENGATKRDNTSKPEDDLRWVEEHIPSSAAENVFPLVDSDEEIATTKLHLNKME